MNSPKILVASPLYDKMEYCFDKFIEAVLNIDYDNFQILIIDNSRSNDFIDKISYKYKGDNITFIKDNTTEEKNKLRLISSRNKIIDFALKGNYEYILMLDSDVIIPKNILIKLLSSNKEIISGIYFNQFIIDGKPKWRPVVYCHISPEEYDIIRQKVKFPPIVKSHEDLRRHLTIEEANSNKIFRVKIPSAGCMLIKKTVFEKIRYGLLDLPENIRTADDIYFCFKAHESGHEIFCDTSIKCDHLVEGKFVRNNEGEYIHPMHN